MAKQALATIKNWFQTRMKPTQAQYWDVWDSFWHKDETIPVAKVENLSSILNSKATTESVNNAMTAINGLSTALGDKVDKVDGLGLSQENFTTELKDRLIGIEDSYEFDSHAQSWIDDRIISATQIGSVSTWYGIACSSDAKYLIAGTNGYGFTISTDYGESWSVMQPAGAVNDAWSNVAISADGTLMLAAARNSGRIYKSTDYGVSWAEIQPAGDFDKSWGCVECSASGQYVIAGCQYGRLYKSTDYGISWAEIQPAGNFDKIWQHCCISDDGMIFIAGTNQQGEFYMTRDGGVTYDNLYDFVEELVPVTIGSAHISAGGDKIVLSIPSVYTETGAYGGYLLVSFDSGINFLNEFNQPHSYYDSRKIHMSRDGSYLLASENDRVGISKLRAGGDFTFHNTRIRRSNPILCASDDASIVYVYPGDGYLYRLNFDDFVKKSEHGERFYSRLLENTTSASETVVTGWSVLSAGEKIGQFKVTVTVRNLVTAQIKTLMSIMSFDCTDLPTCDVTDPILADSFMSLELFITPENKLAATVSGMVVDSKRLLVSFERVSSNF